MPQATEELRAKFPEGDTEAISVLHDHFVWNRPKPFVIRRIDPTYMPTEREYDAIAYLIHEWDWAWEG